VSKVEPLFLCCDVRALCAVSTTVSQLIPFSTAEWYFSSLQVFKSIQSNDYRWKRSGCEGGHFHVVSRSRLLSYSSRPTPNKGLRCDSVAKPKRCHALQSTRSQCIQCCYSKGKGGLLNFSPRLLVT